MIRAPHLPLLLTALSFAVPLAAQEHRSTVGTAGHIASQPVRDVGLSKTKIPAVLQRAAAAPYGSAGTSNCAAIVNSLIPFRSVVREVSGAAAAQRRLAAAVQAGYARRGYLHGLAAARGCSL